MKDSDDLLQGFDGPEGNKLVLYPVLETQVPLNYQVDMSKKNIECALKQTERSLQTMIRLLLQHVLDDSC